MAQRRVRRELPEAFQVGGIKAAEHGAPGKWRRLKITFRRARRAAPSRPSDHACRTLLPNLCLPQSGRKVLRAGVVLVRRPDQSSGTELAFMSLISHLPLTLTRASSELVWAAMLFFALST